MASGRAEELTLARAALSELRGLRPAGSRARAVRRPATVAGADLSRALEWARAAFVEEILPDDVQALVY